MANVVIYGLLTDQNPAGAEPLSGFEVEVYNGAELLTKTITLFDGQINFIVDDSDPEITLSFTVNKEDTEVASGLGNIRLGDHNDPSNPFTISVDETPIDHTGPQGAQGPQGQQGPQGPTGATGSQGPAGDSAYIYVRYSANADGTGLTTTPQPDSEYIGVHTGNVVPPNTEDKAIYSWSLYRGADGAQGPQGPQGSTGATGSQGPAGDSAYIYVRYSANADGTGLTTTPQPDSEYIGIHTASSVPADTEDKAIYSWSLYRGADGAQGPQGNSITSASIDSSGDLIIDIEGQGPQNVGQVTCADGQCICSIQFIENRKLLITYSDDTTEEIDLITLIMGLPQKYTVEGIVASINGLPLSGYIVRAYHKNFETLTQLGTDATTSNSGEYEITFDQDDVDALGLESPDLMVKVFDPTETASQESPVIINAPVQNVINIAFGTGDFKHLIEYEFLNARVTPHITGSIDHYLTPKAVSEIANKTKSRIEDINHLVQVKKIANDTSLDEAMLYGLSKLKNFESLEDMLNATNDELKAILLEAVANGKLQDTITEGDIDGFILALKTYGRNDILNTSNGDMVRLNLFMEGIGIDTDPVEQEAFIDALLNLNGGGATDLNTALTGKSYQQDVSDYIEVLGVTNEFDIARQFKMRTTKPKDILDLSDNEIATTYLDATGIDWNTDSRFEGADKAEKQEKYIKFLRDQVEDTYPGVAYQKKLEADSTIKDANFTQFFADNATFDYNDTSVNEYLANNASALNNIADIYSTPEKTYTLEEAKALFTADLESSQRLFKIAPKNNKYDAAAQMWSNNIRSAADIHKMGRKAFTNKLAGADMLDQAGIDEMFDRASSIAAHSMHLMANFKSDFNSINPYVIPGMQLTGDTPGAELPNLEGLFGAQDLCSCEHCRSVYSAAAYMVDLLQWLKEVPVSSPSNTSGTPVNEATVIQLQQALDLRRPEIKHIELSCENTNTPLPYVDLVNEVLENAIVTHPTFTLPSGVGPNPNRQTTQKAAYLKAHPEHIIPAVYDELRAQVYPWSAPFDIFDAEAHIYFHHLGMDMAKVLDLLDSSAQSDDIAAKYLQVNPLDKAIIINDSTELTNLYGSVPTFSEYFGGTSVSAIQNNFKLFMDHSGLTFNELEAYYASWFINPEPSPEDTDDDRFKIWFIDSDCSPSNARTDMDQAAMLRLMRFHKLRMHLDWSITTLDRVILTLPGGSALDATKFSRIAGVKKLADKYRLDPEEVATWFGDLSLIEYNEKPSYFTEQFVNPSANNVDESYILDSLSGDPEYTLSQLFDQDNSTTNALSILTPEVLQLVIAGTGLTDVEVNLLLPSGGTLTNDNLSYLFRVSSFCHALSISVAEYKEYVVLFDIDPILPDSGGSTPDPDTSMQFIELLEATTKLKLSADELKYIIQHDTTTDSALGYSDWITQLDALHDELVEARDALHIVGEDSRDTIVQQLNLFLNFEQPTVGSWTQSDLDDIIAILDGTSNRVVMDNASGESQEERIQALFADVLSTGQLEDLVLCLLDSENYEGNTGYINYSTPYYVGLENTELRYSTALIPSGTNLIQAAVDTLIWPEVRRQIIMESLSEYFEADAALLNELLTNRLIFVEDPNQDSVYTLDVEGLNMITLFTGSEFISGPMSGLSTAIREKFVINGRLLHKNLLLAMAMKYGTEALDYLFPAVINTGLPDLNNLFNDQSAAISSFNPFWLIGLEHRNNASAGSLFAILDDAEVNANSTSVITALQNLTGWREVEETMSATVLNLTTTGDFATPDWFYDVKTVSTAHAASFVTPASIKDWTKIQYNAQVVQALSNAGKAKYGEEQWLKVGTEMRDALRVQQRDALADYMVFSNSNYDFEDRYALFEYFLIDTEMEPCMMTTRIVQANGSIQLFVQRLLMNLEQPAYALDRDHVKEWEWRKNYRVWEANRKVFLYPENWIEPELRDDKSPFFRELEEELQQRDITTETATEAYLNYLEKLDDVADMEVAQLYMDTDTDILHVFARTRSYPHKYYYRKWVDDAWWTPWEPIEQDIEGEHLIPVVYNGRLMLFWPSFIQGAPRTETAKSQKMRLGAKNGTLRDTTYSNFEIFLNWTELKGKKWTKRKRSKNSVFFEYNSTDYGVGEKDLYFKSRLENGALEIDIFQNHPADEVSIDGTVTYKENLPASMGLVASFDFGGCSKEPEIAYASKSDKIQGLLNVPLTHHQFFYEKSGQIKTQLKVTAIKGSEFDVWVNDDSSKPTISQKLDFILLKKLKPRTRLVIPQQINRHYPHIFGNLPFFFEDELRTFFVRPRPEVKEITHIGYSNLGAAVSSAQSTTGINNMFGQSGMNSDSGSVYNGNVYSQSLFYTGNSDSTSMAVSGNMVMSANVQQYTYTETVEEFTNKTKYQFHSFQHPLICSMVKQLNRRTVDGLLKPVPGRSTLDDMLDRQLHSDAYFNSDYDPQSPVYSVYPKDNFDYSLGGGYSIYNWEIFFHTPMMVAVELTKNQRFAEAQKWFHYIFDPTQVENLSVSTEQGVKRFWRTKPFHEFNGESSINKLMEMLNDGDEEMQKQVEVWRKHPFMPHAIARLRYVAYMKNVVMKYIDMLIAWGDQLFTMDTMESVNEALQVYILAAQILGRRPELINREGPGTETYNSLAPYLDGFSNAMVSVENIVPATYVYGRRNVGLDSRDFDDNTNYITTVDMLYFCIPKNDKLWGYWDTVYDRLFKIRHCMNIEGVVRMLPIFAPPIDPGMLVKAAAAGLSIGAALADMNAPMPFYKYQYLYQKAMELCNDLKSLGGGLLSALEKKDAEALALVRSEQEVGILELTTNIKKKAIEEAEQNIVALQATKAITAERMKFYKARKKQHSAEKKQMNKIQAANAMNNTVAILRGVSAAVENIPKVSTGIAGLGGLLDLEAVDGKKIAKAVSYGTEALAVGGGILSSRANVLGLMAGHEIRYEDWQFQAKQAKAEIAQIEKQILAAQIRKAMAETDLDNHTRQIENAKDIGVFMEDKFTNEELYSWMSKELSKIYFQAYKMAYDMAKKAEKAYHYEVGFDDTNSYVSFGLWDSLRKGLLTGEKLHQDLKRLDIAFTDKNKREIELSKKVSLAMLNPDALERLRQTGKCDFDLTELLYDLDHPGHYMRRIKAVTVSVPCVTGPYTGVTGKLSLLGNKIRKDSSLSGGYDEVYGSSGDGRFVYNLSGIQSIATSRGQDDSGLFELNFNDARYLPFEGAGAISSWRFELPFTSSTGASTKLRQFDYSTISDLIVTVHYTARDAGALVKDAAEQRLVSKLHRWLSYAVDTDTGLFRAFSLKHEFPTEYHQFLNPTDSAANNECAFTITNRHFPQALSDVTKMTGQILLLVKFKDGYEPLTTPPFSSDAFSIERADLGTSSFTEFHPSGGSAPVTVNANSAYGGLSTEEFLNASTTEAIGEWKLIGSATAAHLGSLNNGTKDAAPADDNQLIPEAIDDIILIMNYKKSQ